MMKELKVIFGGFLCFIGKHDWINQRKAPYPIPEKGECISIRDLHKCSRCGKEEYKGMGTIT